MSQDEYRKLIESELQQLWLRYMHMMIESNTIHCSKTELDTFYRVWTTDSYSFSDAVVLNHLLKKHPLKKLKHLTNDTGAHQILFK